MGRRVVAILVVAVAALTLAGCSPATRGLIGVQRDDGGTPVVIFAPCEGALEEATLNEIDMQAYVLDEVKDWRFDPDLDIRTLDFLTDVDLSATKRYEVRAWAKHGAWIGSETKRLDNVWFDAKDLLALNDDEVLYGDPEAWNSSLVGSRDEFEAAACSSN